MHARFIPYTRDSRNFWHNHRRTAARRTQSGRRRGRGIFRREKRTAALRHTCKKARQIQNAFVHTRGAGDVRAYRVPCHIQFRTLYWLGMMFAAIFCSAGIICAVCEKERLNGRKRSILAAVWVVAIAAALCFLTAGLFISAGYTMLVLMLLAPVTLLAAAIAHVVINNKFIKKINKNN